MTKTLTTFFLHTGFAETYSWAGVPMIHRKGFSSVYAAFCDLHDCFVEATGLQGKKLVQAIQEMIRGTFESMEYDILEILEAHGWCACPTYGHQAMMDGTCFAEVSRAPELISDPERWKKTKNTEYVVIHALNGKSAQERTLAYFGE